MAKRYKITIKAGTHVAGRKNPGAGSVLTLTDKQAEQPLRDGAIVPEGQSTVAPAAVEPEADKQAKQPARKPAAEKPASND
ncbi:hypothetical protein PE067_10650 [Paracoccus sp. DMF-8]|uniref:hypothetical protein n=1 Tax=Paracoccus sp. DMF-8 TaxID=3019445 RepID=UPI0023E839E1|nr:hypothetical protein [Paracoccus sp. DMF-8]MDF3606560.1 hypothetical protein [Paracoccus sp. DMF-8]